MFMKKNQLLLIAATAALLVSCGNKGAMTGDNSFPVQTVTPQSATLQSTYPAVIRGIQDVEIRPKVSGYITDIYVKEGSVVTKGQTLFVIDQIPYQTELQTAIANVDVAKAAVDAAELTTTSKEALFEQNDIVVM